MQPFNLLLPNTIEEALLLRDESEDALFWGGGAASTILMKQGLLAPETVIGLEEIEGLRGISRLQDGGIRLGAMVRLREIELSPFLAGVVPSLSETASIIANVRVRNVATLGGHLVHADPAQDLPPLLLALDAVVRLKSREGERVMPLKDFFVDTMETVILPEELVVDVTIPADAVSRASRYVKFRPRSQDDYCTVGVAVSLALEDDHKTIRVSRIAVGGAGPIASRFEEAEQLLVGHSLTPSLLEQVGQAIHESVEPWDDARGSERYKRDMASVWTKRLLQYLTGTNS